MDEQQPSGSRLPLTNRDGEGWLGELAQSRDEPDTIERGSAKRGKPLGVIIEWPSVIAPPSELSAEREGATFQ